MLTNGKETSPYQKVHQGGQQHVLDALHAHGQHLDAEQVVELVHGQPGEGVRLAEDDAAAVQVIITHDALAVVPGPAELPLPEGLIKAVVGVAGDEPDPDLGLFRKETCAKISALFAYYIHQFTIYDAGGDGLAGTNGIYGLKCGSKTVFAGSEFTDEESNEFFFEANLGVEENESNICTIYPNPSNGILNIEALVVMVALSRRIRLVVLITNLQILDI